MTPRDDRGSTIPLILGFFVLALLVVAGSLAAGDAFVRQRDLQSVCDGAALAAAGSAIDLNRTAGVGTGTDLHFTDVDAAVGAYLSRDPASAQVEVDSSVSPDGQTIHLSCSDRVTIVFGSFFGDGAGIDQHADSSARAPLS